MSKKEHLKKSLQDEIQECDMFLSDTKTRADLVPSIEERKREAQAKLDFVETAPDDAIEELGDGLYRLQRDDQEQFRSFLPQSSQISPAGIEYLSTSTGTSSAYIETYRTLEISGVTDAHPELKRAAAVLLSVLGTEKARNENLIWRLNKINRNLGDIYLISRESLAKARAGVLGIDQAAIHLRDVIEQLWGGLANIARDLTVGQNNFDNLELRKLSSRDLVAQTLSENENDEMRLNITLRGLSDVHSQLSETGFGKNPLTTDIDRLNTLFERSTIYADDIAAYLHSRNYIS